MGNTSGNANSFFGFQRWVQGWIEDSEVICDYTTNSSVIHSLTPLNQNSGKKLFVHPIDGTLALVIEFRTESEFDVLKGNDGLLVYLIDMKVASLQGPISIQPSEQDIVLSPRNDVERYSTAPLSTGQSVRVKDLVIVADAVGKDQASFRVLTKAEFLIKQEADAKATAEIKAKQDAEARTAAELKAKQETEAKQEADRLAVELKAKQEAEVKAAAELKAKQEAEAKAAAELKAKQEAEAQTAAAAKAAALKKTTITCVKGKLTKKVTAVKPLCSAGFKKK
jgi:hypothetical protein